TPRLDPGEVAHLVYRESPAPIVPSLVLESGRAFETTFENPPIDLAGMKSVPLDTQGRLRAFRAIPEHAPAGSERRVDWTPFLRESGVDLASVVSTTPAGDGAIVGDPRHAWRARY